MINLNGTFINTPEELEAAKIGLSQEVQDMIHASFYNLPNIPSLSNQKITRKVEIDVRTAILISQGFIFDGEVFSLSDLAQINWIGLKQACDNGLLMYPFPISTKNDGEFFLTDANHVASFYTTGLSTKIGRLAGGRSLKLGIESCNTIEELNELQDNR